MPSFPSSGFSNPQSLSVPVTLIQGTDYFAADSRSLIWTDVGSLWPDLTSASVTFTGSINSPTFQGIFNLNQSGTVLTATGANKQVQVEIPATSLVNVGYGTYSVYAVLSDSHKVELARGTFSILHLP